MQVGLFCYTYTNMLQEEDFDEDDKCYVVTVIYSRFDMSEKQLKNLAIECCCDDIEEFAKSIKLYFSDQSNANAFVFFMNEYLKKKKNI